MIIKGNARAGAKNLAEHVQRVDTNERVQLIEIRGVVAEDVLGALREMEAVAACTRTTKPLYHASINTLAKDKLTDEQRMHAVDRLEQELGLTGQPRVVIVHEKKDREHCHVIWSRTDLEHSRAIRMDHNFRTHEKVARELERTFGHERVQGAHIERDGQPRPERTPGHDEMQQAERGAVTPKEAKALITELWRQTESGQAFKAALEDREWVLARGDRRDFVAVDPAGGTHSLARRVEGAKAADIRERMADVDPARLPSVDEARQQQQTRQAERQQQQPQVEAGQAQGAPPRDASRGPEPDVLPSLPPSTSEPPPRERSSWWGPLWGALTERFQAPAGREAEAAAATLTPAPAERMADMPVGLPAGRGDERAAEALSVAGPDANPERGVEKGLMMVADLTGRAAETLADFVEGLTDMFSGSPPPRQYSAAELARDAAARREVYAQQEAERASGQALDRLRDDMQAGRGLDHANVRALTQDQLLGIRAHGDAYLVQLIEDRERDARSRGSGGIERERDR